MHDAATRLKDCAIDRSADGSGELLHGGVAAIARAALGDDPASGPDGPATRRDQARVLRAIVDRHGREALLRAGARLDAASGDPIVLVAASARHRRDAFAATEFAMDHLKSESWFWKREKAGGAWRWIEPRDVDFADLARWG